MLGCSAKEDHGEERKLLLGPDWRQQSSQVVTSGHDGDTDAITTLGKVTKDVSSGLGPTCCASVSPFLCGVSVRLPQMSLIWPRDSALKETFIFLWGSGGRLSMCVRSFREAGALVCRCGAYLQDIPVIVLHIRPSFHPSSGPGEEGEEEEEEPLLQGDGSFGEGLVYGTESRGRIEMGGPAD